MRLLNAETFELIEIVENQIPPYAILSHCWKDEEITFLEMENKTADKKDRSAWFKIKRCCTQALEDGLNYVWIDTCCIDKRSSAELSEAINSMFRWYQNAVHCYAFLEDVPANSILTGDASPFVTSNWFKRGWTLQELIAPTSVKFYTCSWTFIGTKKSLCEIILMATGIPKPVLEGGDVRRASIAKRMSWASQRQTTRGEDMAYCLLGLFDVNMPLLCGEGGIKAFLRLQEEILKTSLDHSLFAWGFTRQASQSSHQQQVGALAKSPAAFGHASNIIPYQFSGVAPYSMANKGLRLELPLLRDRRNNVHAVLRCHHEGYIADELALPLVSLGSNQYARRGLQVLQKVADLALHGERDLSQRIYIDQYQRDPLHQNTVQSETHYDQEYMFWIKELPRDRRTVYQLIDVHPYNCWDRSNNTFDRTDQYISDEWKIILRFKTTDSVPPQAFVITAGFGRKSGKLDLTSWCAAQQLNEQESLHDTLTNLTPTPAVVNPSFEIKYSRRRLRVKVFPERLIGENVHTIDINFL